MRSTMRDRTALMAVPGSAAEDVEETRDRRGIQSIEVGGQLLLALGRTGKPMVLKELAREAGMPAAKAHPYLVSFARLGLIEQDPPDGTLRAGSAIASARTGQPSAARSGPHRHKGDSDAHDGYRPYGRNRSLGKHGADDHPGRGIKPRAACQSAHRHGDVVAEHGDRFGLRGIPSAQSG